MPKKIADIVVNFGVSVDRLREAFKRLGEAMKEARGTEVSITITTRDPILAKRIVETQKDEYLGILFIRLRVPRESDGSENGTPTRRFGICVRRVAVSPIRSLGQRRERIEW